MATSPGRALIEVGTVIDGTYIVEGLLGRGGMGAVFLASHNRLEGKKVAIKMLHVETSGGDVLARFKTEADIAAKLNHPNIVAVIDYDKLDDGTPFIIYEFLEGESLAQRLADRGALELGSVCSIMRQVGSALSAAHRAGIVHRDLKPANIFLVPTVAEGRAVEVAKVLDFGISKILDGSSQVVKTQEATLLGTPQYMSPEQANGQHSIIDARTDIFALGEILYEMVSGAPAFTGSSIPEVVYKVVYEPPRPLAETAPGVPEPIVAVIMKALEKRPEDRYQSVNDLVEALTGSPLGLAHKPRASLAGEKPASQSAFAPTEDSGDRGVSPTAAIAATAPATAPVATAARDARQPMLASPPPASPPARVRSRRARMFGIAGAITILGVVFVALFVALFVPLSDAQRVEPPPTVRSAPAALEQAPPAQLAEAPRVAPGDAAVAPAEHASSASPKSTGKPELTERPAVANAASQSLGEPDVEPLLGEADEALGKRDWDKLIEIANRILAFPKTSASQGAKAKAYRGMAMCAGHNNDEAARTDLRALVGAPTQRARLLRFCKSEHHLEADQ